MQADCTLDTVYVTVGSWVRVRCPSACVMEMGFMHCMCWAWRSEGQGVQLSVEILPSMLQPPVQFQKLTKGNEWKERGAASPGQTRTCVHRG